MAPPPFKVVGPLRSPLTVQETAETLNISPSDMWETLAAVDAVWHDLPASRAARPRAKSAKATSARKSTKPVAKRAKIEPAKAVRRTKIAKRAKRR